MAEARVDYMSSCILLGQASQLTVAVKDLWEGLQLAGQGDTEEANIQVSFNDPLTMCVTVIVAAGTGRPVLGASPTGHPQNHHKICNEYFAEDPRLCSSAEASQ